MNNAPPGRQRDARLAIFRGRREWLLAALCAVCTAAVLTLYATGFAPLLKAETYFQDLRAQLGRPAPADPRLVFVGIDKAAYRDVPLEQDDEARQSPTLLALRENFPWPRHVWAELIERLAQAGARTIVIDLLFAAPAAGDDELARVLEKYKDRVVIGSNFSDGEQAGGSAIVQTLPSASLLPSPPAGSISFDDRVGFVNVWPDADGVVRGARFRLSDASLYGFDADEVSPKAGGRIHESIAARALRKFGRPDAVPPGEEPRLFRYAGPPGRGYPPHPLNEIFSRKIWENNYDRGEFFRDKLVLVGPSANFFHDQHATPFSFPRTQMAGPEIHLNIIGAALHGEFLRGTPREAGLLTIAGAGLCALLLGRFVKQAVKRLALALLLSLGYGLAAQWLFNHAGLIVLAISPLLVLISSAVCALAGDFFHERTERTRTRKTLERYVSKNLVGELLDNPASFAHTLNGVRRPVTVLFSDVRNFTSLTEETNEAQLVLQLNEYFTEMVRIVFANHGTLDKFIGDALMAVWGNIVTHGPATDTERAVTAALQMQASLAQLNARWLARGWPQISVGIGINQGEAIVGNLGSVEKMELTVIGDTVNLASRLEGLTKQYGLHLLIGESAAQLVRPHFVLRTVDLVQVKGKSRPAEISSVLGPRTTAQAAEEPWLRAYESGIQFYRRRAFAEATHYFEEALGKNQNDFLSAFYLERCRDLVATPPGEEWQGVYLAKVK